MGFYLLRGGRKSDGRPHTVSRILQILHSMSSPAGVPPGMECEFARLSGPLNVLIIFLMSVCVLVPMQ